MKKQISILLLGLTVALCGCQENKEQELSYETVAIAADDFEQIFSEGTGFAEIKNEDAYQNKKAVQEKKGSFLSTFDELIYQETESILFMDYSVDTYINKTDPQVKYQYFTNSDTLLLYRNEAGLDIGIAADASEEAIYLALEGLLSEKLLPEDVDVKQLRRMVYTRMLTDSVEDGIPTLTSNTVEGYVLPDENQKATYIIYYTYPVGDVDSYETYEFILTEEHILRQYRAPRPEIFNLSDDAIDKEKMQESVERFCKESFAEGTKEKQTNGQFWYWNSDGKLAVLTFMEVEYEKEGDLRGEIINLITTLE